MNYKIILDEPLLDAFLASLPSLRPHEVWYFCLFGRHKYDPGFPNTRDSGQLARAVARDQRELKEKLLRLESPLGSYSRHGVPASQECLSVYMAMNPRNLVRANKGVLLEMAKRMVDGPHDFNPISVATTEIHRAVDRKLYIDFDFDDADHADYVGQIREILPDPAMCRVLKTRGGFHLLVCLDQIRNLKTQWHPAIAKLPKCDVRGSNTLTPVPGCTQGGFTPHFVEFGELARRSDGVVHSASGQQV